jgi:hypothetical protein
MNTLETDVINGRIRRRLQASLCRERVLVSVHVRDGQEGRPHKEVQCKV